MAIELETTPQEYKAAAPTLKGRTFQVHETYRWTLNGNNGVRKYVPYIYLKEYKLTQSGEISSLRNSLASIQESTLVRTVFGAQLGAAAGTAVGNFFGRPGRVVGRVAGRVAGAASGALGADGEFLTNNLLPGQEIHYLSPYDGLYPAVETGFEYYLPYLNIDNMTVAAGNWSTIEDSTAARTLGQVLGLGSQLISESGSGYLKQLGDLLGTAKKAAVAEATLTNPGAAIEQIKKFSPVKTGDTVDVVFYLFNTEDINDIRNNWEFLFTLTYQNLPNRKSVNLLDPPSVYSIEVPGYKRFPIAVIEAFSVVNEGTTRLINLRTGQLVTPGSVGPDVKLIPEAFKVTLKISSLLMNTRNLYYYANDNTNKIAVTRRTPVQAQTETETQTVIRERIVPGAGLPVTGGGSVGGFVPRGGFPTNP